VPDAVAITGWDDSDAAAPAGLTTLWQSLRDQGKRCARIALSLPPPAAYDPAAYDPASQEPPDWRVIPRTSTR
jgi:DNA-binding LacI/PurR family transcriptional regulator